MELWNQTLIPNPTEFEVLFQNTGTQDLEIFEVLRMSLARGILVAGSDQQLLSLPIKIPTFKAETYLRRRHSKMNEFSSTEFIHAGHSKKKYLTSGPKNFTLPQKFLNFLYLHLASPWGLSWHIKMKMNKGFMVHAGTGKERKGKKRIGYKRKEKEKKKKKEVGCDLKLGVSCCSEGP